MTKRCALLLALLATVGCKKGGDAQTGPLRLGFFPNITHAQALVGHADGTFKKALGDKGVWVMQFNAGPAAMEALLAGSLDATYVGPGPAINTFIKTKGAIRVIAGSATGGAVLVARSATTAQALSGKRVATPQLGNTQDIALRHWLKENNLTFTTGTGESKGKVKIVPVANPDILSLFQRGEIEAAWVPEPWGARLMEEASAKLLLDERTLWPEGQFPTTLLVVSERALKERREEVKALLKAHVELTQRFKQNGPEFVKAANQAYGKLTQHPLPEKVLESAFSRMSLSTDPLNGALAKDAKDASELGFSPNANLEGFVDTALLEELGAAPPKS
ncbi:MAG: ABC transporter substrate-binding protein [Myxococcaceae bacterium]